MGIINRILRRQKKLNKQATTPPQETNSTANTPKTATLSMRTLVDSLKGEGQPSDLVIREFKLGNREAALIFFNGLADKKSVDGHLLRPLFLNQNTYPETPAAILDFLKNRVLTVAELSEVPLEQVMTFVIEGDTALVVDGSPQALIASTKGWKTRAIEPPRLETAPFGSQEAFTENLIDNLTLIRRRIKDPTLAVEIRELGVRSRTRVALLYMKNIANPDIVIAIKKRLEQINIDSIPASGVIQELFEKRFTVVPLFENTERPDKVTAGILSGRVALIVDTTPFALILPAVFVQFFMASEDYYSKWLPVTIIRFFRVLATLFATTLPAIYISLVSFHPEMMPTSLLFTLERFRSSLPFPLFVDIIVLEIAIEIIREASLRLPGTTGQTIGIVGGLIMGQAAVSAGLVSPISLIIVAITTISSFAIPSFHMALSLRAIRFVLIGFASLFGLYGTVIGSLLFITHLASLKTFGISYLAPLAPLSSAAFRDTLFRLPWPLMTQRPDFMHPQEITRQRRKPQPQKKGGHPDAEQR
jgi:hypothetical protein